MPRLMIPIVSAIRGGAEDYAAAIAAHAARNDFDVHVLLPIQNALDELETELCTSRINVERLPIAQVATRVNSPFRPNHIRQAIHRIQPDAVLLPLPGIRYGAGIIEHCIHARVPCVPVFQLIRWEQWTIRLGDHLVPLLGHDGVHPVVVSDRDRDTMIGRAGLPEDRVATIHNGIDVDRFALTDDARRNLRVDFRRALGIPEESLVGLAVGRLDVQKGCDTLVAALPKLVQQRPNLHLVWAGDGPLAGALLHDAHIMGIANNLHLLGRRNDIPELLGASDLFLFPSRFEGFPFALLEAMAGRVPIVASDIPPVREALVADNSAWFAPPGDIYRLRRAIARALANPKEARERAERAFKRAHRFSQHRMCRQTLSLIQSILRAPARV